MTQKTRPRDYGRLRAASVYPLILLLSCGRSQDKTPQKPSATEFQPLPAETGAILPIDEGSALVHACTRRHPHGVRKYSMPSREEIARIEMLLPYVMDSVFRKVYRDGHASPNPNTFYRQYMGITRWDGRYSIYINAFSKDYLRSVNSPTLQQIARGEQRDTLKWRVSPIIPCDGGARFFGVEYNPRNATLGLGKIHFNHRASGPVRY